jgi:hypothetical protein
MPILSFFVSLIRRPRFLDGSLLPLKVEVRPTSQPIIRDNLRQSDDRLRMGYNRIEKTLD